MIKQVIHWSNNAVMVFDEKGNQMPKLQGNYLKVRKKILRSKSLNKEQTKFFRADWGNNCVGWKEITIDLF